MSYITKLQILSKRLRKYLRIVTEELKTRENHKNRTIQTSKNKTIKSKKDKIMRLIINNKIR